MTGNASEANYAWTTDPFDSSQKWSGGTEVWCNMPGRYVHAVADMRTRSNWKATVCALGVMGTIY